MGVYCFNPSETSSINITDIKVTELESSLTNNNSSIIMSKVTSNLPSNSTLIQINIKQGPILKKIMNKRKRNNFSFV
jgi:hypothetical protein